MTDIHFRKEKRERKKITEPGDHRLGGVLACQPPSQPSSLQAKPGRDSLYFRPWEKLIFGSS